MLDYNKCHPEKCDKGICAAVEACPVKVIKQEASMSLRRSFSIYVLAMNTALRPVPWMQSA